MEHAEAIGFTQSDQVMFRTIGWRLMPIIICTFILSYVDRSNVSFSKLQMSGDIHLSEAAYGVGATIFIAAYNIFAIPSSLILGKLGVRSWIATIMVAWGLFSVGTAWVTNGTEYYISRLIVGAAEAGLVPCVIFYLTQWFPKQYLTKAISVFIAGAPVAGVIAGPLSGWILHSTTGLWGMRPWRWLFIIEGVPAALLAVIILLFLAPSPERASWLSYEDKGRLKHLLALEAGHKTKTSFLSVVTSMQVWLLGLSYGCTLVAFYGLLFWLPTMIGSLGIKDPLAIGEVSAIPWLVGVVTMVLVARYVDKRQNAGAVLITIVLLQAVAWLILSHVKGHANISLALLTITTAGQCTAAPLLWKLVTSAFRGPAVASASAAVQSIATTLSMMFPTIIGFVLGSGTRFAGVMVLFAAMMFLEVLLLLWAVSARRGDSAERLVVSSDVTG